ncbi:hypothetical protein BOTU111922_22845 [Bordetella tumulicola]
MSGSGIMNWQVIHPHSAMSRGSIHPSTACETPNGTDLLQSRGKRPAIPY